jgi:hypothetical protein
MNITNTTSRPELDQVWSVAFTQNTIIKAGVGERVALVSVSVVGEPVIYGLCVPSIEHYRLGDSWVSSEGDEPICITRVEGHYTFLGTESEGSRSLLGPLAA